MNRFYLVVFRVFHVRVNQIEYLVSVVVQNQRSRTHHQQEECTFLRVSPTLVYWKRSYYIPSDQIHWMVFLLFAAFLLLLSHFAVAEVPLQSKNVMIQNEGKSPYALTALREPIFALGIAICCCSPASSAPLSMLHIASLVLTKLHSSNPYHNNNNSINNKDSPQSLAPVAKYPPAN